MFWEAYFTSIFATFITFVPFYSSGRCKKPPDVPNASHDGQPDLEYYPLRTQVRYACWAGYQQDGFERAMCVGEGRWVGPRMKCSRK